MATSADLVSQSTEKPASDTVNEMIALGTVCVPNGQLTVFSLGSQGSVPDGTILLHQMVVSLQVSVSGVHKCSSPWPSYG